MMFSQGLFLVVASGHRLIGIPTITETSVFSGGTVSDLSTIPHPCPSSEWLAGDSHHFLEGSRVSPCGSLLAWPRCPGTFLLVPDL